jgi:predicted DNA-binding transcriptional regulator YafY
VTSGLSRCDRLIAALRRRKRPVSAARLAAELGVTPSAIARDIGALVAQGAVIAGSAEQGYVLKADFLLRPLMFSEDEADALMLGLHLVAAQGDLASVVERALAKIEAALPEDLPIGSVPPAAPSLAVIHAAIEREEKLRLRYRDKMGATTERVVWPIAVTFFEAAEMLAAWCEMRRDFRHFRLDRIASATPGGGRYPRRRRVLLAEWQVQRELDELG